MNVTASFLFGIFRQRRPAHGSKKRWKDCVARDLCSRGMDNTWYLLARDSRSQ